MQAVRKLVSLWRSLFQKARLDRELDDELQAYLDGLIERKIRAGEDPAAARRAALLETGGMSEVKAAVQRARIGAGIDAIFHDIRFTLRSILRRPAFAFIVILTFAFGVGANTAIFSIVNAVLIQPLPYKDSSRLTFVWSDVSSAGYPRAPLSGPELHDLRERSTLFTSFGAIWANTAVLGDGDPEELRIGFVTANFFDTLGASALIGRTFESTDETSDGPQSILLSWPVWQRRFGGDRSIVGRRILVNGDPMTVIGVMPPDFRLLFPPDASVPEWLEAWIPFYGQLATRPRGQNFLRVIGRMKPDVRLTEAREEVSEIASRISREYAQYGPGGRVFRLVGLQSENTRDARAGLVTLLIGVAILLMAACLNVASLLIARAAARTKETAVRFAIGASPRQIFRQCFVEGMTLALLGAIAGVLFGELSLRALVALRPAALSRIASAGIDTTVLLLTGSIIFLCGLLFSFAPLAAMFRADVIGDVWGRAGPAAGRHRARAFLVTLQIAFSVVLLVGAGLMIRTFASIQQIDPGYTSERMLTLRVSPPFEGPFPEQEGVNVFHRNLQARLAALQGVKGVGAVSHLPFDNIPNWGYRYITTQDQQLSTGPFADYRAVSPGYLETVGARLVEGRFFSETDAPGAKPVVIVDDLLARRNWPGESAVGKQIAVDPGVSGRPQNLGWATVVGVVRHMRLRSLVEELTDQIYMSIRQVPRPTTYVVSAVDDPVRLAPAVRTAIRGFEPRATVYDVRALDDYLSDAKSGQRFTMSLAAAFALVALTLAFVGVFALVSYSANARRFEFGVRLALGARPRQILRLAINEGIVLVVAGLIIGLAGAAISSRFLQSQLFGVTPYDIPTYLFSISIIVAAGVLASWLPARKAAASNPLDVLRAD
jgi:predicted permease